MRESHLTLRAPAMPGATTRTGKPWSADSSLRAATPPPPRVSARARPPAGRAPSRAALLPCGRAPRGGQSPAARARAQPQPGRPAAGVSAELRHSVLGGSGEAKSHQGAMQVLCTQAKAHDHEKGKAPVPPMPMTARARGRAARACHSSRMPG